MGPISGGRTLPNVRILHGEPAQSISDSISFIARKRTPNRASTVTAAVSGTVVAVSRTAIFSVVRSDGRPGSFGKEHRWAADPAAYELDSSVNGDPAPRRDSCAGTFAAGPASAYGCGGSQGIDSPQIPTA